MIRKLRDCAAEVRKAREGVPKTSTDVLLVAAVLQLGAEISALRETVNTYKGVFVLHRSKDGKVTT